jgi:hypothetical protein
MNAKILVIAGFAAAAISANAQINLTGAGSFSLGGTFSGLGATPVYTPGSSITTIMLNNTLPGYGSLNQWWFSVVDTGANISTVSYAITLNGVSSQTAVTDLVTAQAFDPATGQVGPSYYLVDGSGGYVDLMPGWNPVTHTLTVTEDISLSTTPTAFFKGNFTFFNVVPEPTGVAALAIGALGLLVRRRKSK